MHPICPSCGSTHIETLNLGKKTGSAVGFIGGAASGASSAMAGARIGATVGAIAGPLGSGIGTVAGAILGALAGGTAGGVAGARLGQIVDERLLDNYHCLKCDHRFSLPETHPPVPEAFDQTLLPPHTH